MIHVVDSINGYNQKGICCYYKMITVNRQFVSECDKGYYGQGCTTKCGKCFDQTDCSRFNGTCLQGCLPGYQRDTCKQREIVV